MSDRSKFVAALVSLLAMAIVASRQLFLFALSRDSNGFLDSQQGRYHLWVAISGGIAACIAGGLLFHFFLRHERKKWSKVPMDAIGTLLAAIDNNPSTSSPTPAPFNVVRWALANPWLSEGQADDRIPMNGSVVHSNGTPSAQRSFARSSHQVMFKKWSQARHD